MRVRRGSKGKRGGGEGSEREKASRGEERERERRGGK